MYRNTRLTYNPNKADKQTAPRAHAIRFSAPWIQSIGFGIRVMGQLEAHRSMFWNLIIKHDPRVRPYHPSSTRNETRHDIVERGARKGIHDRKEKGMSRGISTLPLRYIVPICRVGCVSFRNTSHYMTYGLWWAVLYSKMRRDTR